MTNILTNIPNLKICYLILIILIMAIINITLIKNKKDIYDNYKYLINGIILMIIALITNYYNDIIEGIFNLEYLSIKFYMVILIITNIITLITLQKRLRLPYKIINYTLFILMTISLGAVLTLVIGTKLNIIPAINNQYAIKLLNLSIIIFVIYLILISLSYICIYVYDKRINKKEVTADTVTNKVEETKKLKKEKVKREKKVLIKSLKKKDKTKKENKVIKNSTLSPEELLQYNDKDNFCINGVNCSIIFEDSIPDNIIKNYHILLNDINAKLVNGYTLEENRLLKSICTKLQVSNLSYIDINNLSILNKINVEEYNLLKQIFEQ